jgi:hypothetical protein
MAHHPDDVKSSAFINWSIVIPALTAIFAGLIALLSNIYSTYLNNTNQITLEKQRLKANLIIESIKTGDRARAMENLKFFIESGLIDDTDPPHALYHLIGGDFLPVLPTADIDKLQGLIGRWPEPQAKQDDKK